MPILKYRSEYFEELIKKVEQTQNKQTKCPNCGAAIASLKCEYCGTDFGVVLALLNRR